MKLPKGYVIAAHCDWSHHGGDILVLHGDNLLVVSVDCEMHHVPITSEILAVHYQETVILSVFPFSA